MRSFFPLAVALLLTPACNTVVQLDEGEAACGPKPFAVCAGPCGTTVEVECQADGWRCPDVPAIACESECGPMPEGSDCLDACGDFAPMACIEGTWQCPPEEPGLFCPDEPPGGGKSALWTDSFGSLEYEEVRFVELDDDGNLYVAAQFRNGLWTSETELLEGAGGYDTYVAKYDVDGERQWFLQLGEGGDELPQGLALTPSGDLLLAMSASEEAGFNPALPGPVRLLRIAPEDGVATPAPFALNLVEGNVSKTAFVVGDDGSLIVAGSFAGDITVGDQTLTSAGETDVLVAKLDEGGTPLWARRFGGASFDHQVGLDVDAAGRVFVSGTTRSPLEIDGLTLDNAGAYQGFALMLEPTGQAYAATSFAASPNGAVTTGDIAATGDGGAFVTTTYQGTLTLDGTTYTAPAEATGGLVARLDANGNPVFARDFGPVFPGGSGASHRGWRVAVEPESGDAIIALSLPLDGHTEDTFLARLDPTSGEPRWSRLYGDPNTNRVEALACANGRIALGGAFFSSLSLGLEPMSALTEGSGFVALFDIDAD